MKLPNNTNLNPIKTKNFETIKQKLKILWNNKKVKNNAEKIVLVFYTIIDNKEVYQINFDKWRDWNIFEEVKPNAKAFSFKDEFKYIKWLIYGNGGSANLYFECDDEAVKHVIETLQNNGYEVGFKNYEN